MEYPIQHPLYRCWYPRSAGKLRSGKLNHGSQPVSLTTGDVNAEIQRLRNHQNPVPTALVPTNSEFLLILHVAIRLTYRGIAPNDIVIAFIAPWKSPATIHNGQALIKAAGDPGKIAYRFKHAYYYEWEIPAAHLRHTVTLGTVIRRGFSLAWRSPGMNFPSYLDLLEFLWEWHPDPDPYGKGYRCGLDACEFGLRAPVRQIAGALSGVERQKWWLKKLVEGMEDAIQATRKGCWEDLKAPKPGSPEEKLKLEFERDYERLAAAYRKLKSLLESLPKDDCAARDRTRLRINEILKQKKDLEEELKIDAGY